MLINISDIKIAKRVRKDLGDLETLKDSLRRYGLLNPITINSKHELIAGERRLQAAKQIGWTKINAIIIDNIDPLTQLEMEIEENNQRKPFSDAELLAGYKRLFRLKNPTPFWQIVNTIRRFFTWLRDSIVSLFSKRN